MTKLFMGLCALLLSTLLAIPPAQAQTLGEVQQSIEKGVNSILGNLDVNKLTAKPQRDLLTLAIGGVAGFAAGGFFSGLGILKVEILGVALIPIISGLTGIYMANEGYFDGIRGMVGKNINQ